MPFDPYKVLGVARAASPAAVKDAYRAKVRVAHPDRGGDPQHFMLVVRAFGVLSDPDARRLYDETGIVDDNQVGSYRREVATILADMFDAAVETAVATGLNLKSVDFVRQMTAAVERGLAEARVSLQRTDAEIAALQALRARIRRTDADRNIFAERLDLQIGRKTEAHAGIKRRVAMLETAIAELGSYENEVELIVALETATATA